MDVGVFSFSDGVPETAHTDSRMKRGIGVENDKLYKNSLFNRERGGQKGKASLLQFY